MRMAKATRRQAATAERVAANTGSPLVVNQMKPLAQACRIQARNNQEEQEKAGAARAAAALGRAFRNNPAPPEFAIWKGRLCPKSKIIQKA